MVENSTGSAHPIFRGITALNRGILKRNSGRSMVHFTAESSDIELLFRRIYSAKQLSIDGTLSSWCEDLAQRFLVRHP